MATRYNRYIWAMYLTSNNMLNEYVTRLDRNAITDGSVGSGVRYSYVGEDYILYDGTTISVSREGNQTKFTVTVGGSIPYPHSVSSEYATRLKTLAFECDVQVNQSGWTSFIKQSGVSPFSVTKTYTVNNGFDTVQFRYTFADLNGAAILSSIFADKMYAYSRVTRRRSPGSFVLLSIYVTLVENRMLH